MSESPTKTASRDLESVELPREVWSKSKRPIRGTLFRWSLAVTLLMAGLLMPSTPVRLALVALGIAVGVGLPWLVDGRLEKLGAELGSTPRSKATGVLTSFEETRLVQLFAPHAWVQLQKARLHLILRDGRAAARAFAEAARMLGDVRQPVLVSGQALGLTASGDRKEARGLLLDLEDRGILGARDKLNLGIVHVEEPAKTRRALELLREAHEELGDQPRVLAALALAAVRSGELDEARDALERAEADLDGIEADALAPELLKRARKDVRQAEEREGRGGAEDRSAGKRSAGGKKRGRGKKDRRKERRQKRKQRQPEPAEAPDAASVEQARDAGVEGSPSAAEELEEFDLEDEDRRRAEALAQAMLSADDEAEEDEVPSVPAGALARPEADEDEEDGDDEETELGDDDAEIVDEAPAKPAVTFAQGKPMFAPPPVPPPPPVGSVFRKPASAAPVSPGGSPPALKAPTKPAGIKPNLGPLPRPSAKPAVPPVRPPAKPTVPSLEPKAPTPPAVAGDSGSDPWADFLGGGEDSGPKPSRPKT